MNSMEKIWALALMGLLLFGAVGIASSAEQVLPKWEEEEIAINAFGEGVPFKKGGDSFETANKMQPGNYGAWDDIPLNKPKYFKSEVNAGQMLMVEVTNAEGAEDILSNTLLYDENGTVLLPNHDNPLYNMSGAGKSGRYCWLPNSEKSLYTYYISVAGSKKTYKAGKIYPSNGGTIFVPGDIIIKGTRYGILIEDNFDAGSQTDAGDKFETAMDITQGKYKGYLSGKWGSDKKDLYKMHVEKGKILTVKVTPPSDKRRGVTIYKGDIEVIAEEHPSNLGAIVKVAKEITSSGDLYIGISGDTNWKGESFEVGDGDHSLRWIYYDGSGYGWLDQVVIRSVDRTYLLDDFNDGVGDGWYIYDVGGVENNQLWTCSDIAPLGAARYGGTIGTFNISDPMKELIYWLDMYVDVTPGGSGQIEIAIVNAAGGSYGFFNSPGFYFTIDVDNNRVELSMIDEDGYYYRALDSASYEWGVGETHTVMLYVQYGLIKGGIDVEITPPACSILINDGAEYTTDRTVTLNLSAEDPESGVAEMRFANDHIWDESWSPWVTYNTTKVWNLSESYGEKKVYVRLCQNSLQSSP